MEGPKKKYREKTKGRGGEIDCIIGSHKYSYCERKRKREREMIADAFFAFLSWLRLLFFNREMELALIGTTTTTTTILVFYSDVCRPFI